MSNLIPLPKKPADGKDQVWQCDCGSTTFWLRGDGQAECPACGVEQCSGEGDWTLLTYDADAPKAQVVKFPKR